MEWYTQRDLNP